MLGGRKGRVGREEGEGWKGGRGGLGGRKGRVRREEGRVGREEGEVVQKRKSKERLVYAFSPSPHLSGPEELQHDGGFNGSNHHLQADWL